MPLPTSDPGPAGSGAMLLAPQAVTFAMGALADTMTVSPTVTTWCRSEKSPVPPSLSLSSPSAQNPGRGASAARGDFPTEPHIL